MNKTTVQKQPSVPVMARLSTKLNNKVEELCEQLGYRNKSAFVEHAVIDFVHKLETAQVQDEPIAN